MKKIICFLSFAFILCIFCTNGAFAMRYPQRTDSIKNMGVGVVKLKNNINIYKTPEKNSIVVQKVITEKKKSAIIAQNTDKIVDSLIINQPNKNLFFMTVAESPENDWIEVYYNNSKDDTGYINKEDIETYLTWREFFWIYGRKYGVRFMNNLDELDYYLYSDSNSEAQKVDKLSKYEIDYIKLRFLEGNWVLVTVFEKGNIEKTGWIQWRNDEGQLRLFPKI